MTSSSLDRFATPRQAGQTGVGESTAAKKCAASAVQQTPRRARGAFTLAELLVVIGIILALMALLLPALGKTWQTGVRQRMAADIQAITIGLEAYRQDHRRFPPVTVKNSGANVLWRAMIGQHVDTDGQVRPGFRTTNIIVNGVTQGKVWGPYLQLDRFKATGGFEIADRYGRPILYYAANKAAVAATTDSNNPSFKFIGNAQGPGYYQALDNDVYLPEASFKMLMGANANGTVRSAAYIGDYILWSAGPDQQFGPNDISKPVTSQNRCDDVANFPRSEY